MYSRTDLRLEAQEALENAWFVRSLEEIERTDRTLTLRLTIRSELFVQAFLGERSGSLYFALVEGRRRRAHDYVSPVRVCHRPGALH